MLNIILTICMLNVNNDVALIIKSFNLFLAINFMNTLTKMSSEYKYISLDTDHHVALILLHGLLDPRMWLDMHQLIPSGIILKTSDHDTDYKILYPS